MGDNTGSRQFRSRRNIPAPPPPPVVMPPLTAPEIFRPAGLDQIKFLNSLTLSPIGARLPLGRYFKDLWQRRHFIWQNSLAKAFDVRHQLLLGRAWLILQPLLDAAVYGVIFGLILGTNRGIEHFIAYLMIGVTFFNFMSVGIQQSAGLIRTNRAIIHAFYFPRAALVVSTLLKQVLDFIPTALVTVVACFLIPPAPRPSWLVLLVLPIFLVQGCFVLGLQFWLARLSHLIPDVKPLVGLFLRFWFYGSGVFFSVDRFDQIPAAYTIMSHNPGYLFLDLYRDVIIYARLPELLSAVEVFCWAGAFLVSGFVFFWKGEVSYARGI